MQYVGVMTTKLHGKPMVHTQKIVMKAQNFALVLVNIKFLKELWGPSLDFFW
jgi:hypothetical protein